MLQALDEILVILFLLACLTIVGAGLVDLGHWVLRHPGMGRGFWVSLLGGTLLLFVLLLLLTLTRALTLGAET